MDSRVSVSRLGFVSLSRPPEFREDHDEQQPGCASVRRAAADDPVDKINIEFGEPLAHEIEQKTAAGYEDK